ncbi:MAG: TA system VapC family ribonuclease toxin [Candidatus Limnocylindrales bacterium]
MPDLNLMVYAVDETSPRHVKALSWLEARLNSTETLAFAWSTLNGFVRLSTRSAVFDSPLSPDEAFDLVEAWLARPNVVIVDPAEGHLRRVRDLLAPLGTAGNLVTDAHLAALAIEHGATLESSDHDFGRFADLRWEDPLQDPVRREPGR